VGSCFDIGDNAQFDEPFNHSLPIPDDKQPNNLTYCKKSCFNLEAAYLIITVILIPILLVSSCLVRK
jgi:hypothetical protein